MDEEAELEIIKDDIRVYEAISHGAETNAVNISSVDSHQNDSIR